MCYVEKSNIDLGKPERISAAPGEAAEVHRVDLCQMVDTAPACFILCSWILRDSQGLKRLCARNPYILQQKKKENSKKKI